jgi:hypothetical protein
MLYSLTFPLLSTNTTSLMIYSIPDPTPCLIIRQHRPSLDIINITPAHQLQLIKIHWILNSVDIVIIEHIASMVIGQYSLASRSVNIIVAAVDYVAAAGLEVYAVTVDKRSGDGSGAAEADRVSKVEGNPSQWLIYQRTV